MITEMPKPTALPIVYRTLDLDRSSVRTAEDGARTFRFSVSSEAEIEREDFWSGKKIVEVLSHEKSAVDRSILKDGLPVLADDRLYGHYGDHVGIFTNDALENGKLVGDIRFSRSARGAAIADDVEDGIRNRVSIGYRITKAKVEKAEGNKPERWTATRWTPVEVHILPLGADTTVGPGRSADSPQPPTYPVELEEERTMSKPTDPKPAEGQRSDGAPAATPPTLAVTVVDPPAAEPRNRNKEIAEIMRIAERNGMSARVADWIDKDLNPQQVAMEIVNATRTQGNPSQPASDITGVVPERDLSRYSYTRALRMQLEGGPMSGLEAEVHQELERTLPQEVKRKGGILVPMRLKKRALDASTATKGTEVVDTSQGELIELLRNRSRTLAYGARLLTGLQGPVTFPKQTGALQVSWVAENPGSDVSDSDIALGQVLLTPKTMQGSTAYSRQLLAQTSVDVEMMVREDLAIGHALAVDRAFLHGTGASGEPLGIYNAPDVQIKAMGGAPDFGKLVDMQGLLADKNAGFGNLGYMTTPLMASKLMQTLVASAAGADMIWTGPIGDGQVAGQRATSTNQVRKDLGAGSNEHGLIFGNWADLIAGLWNSMELVVDPYSKKKQALIEVTSFQMGDCVIRHGESFVKATGATV